MQSVAIVGTGLIGASLGLALRRGGFTGAIAGLDTDARECATAIRIGAVDRAFSNMTLGIAECRRADVIVLAVPVLGIMDWTAKLVSHLLPGQLVTDVGSTKRAIAELAAREYVDGGARFLPGHPMAGKESGGAALAEASLFDGAMWLFTPLSGEQTDMEAEWRAWVSRFGCRTLDLEAAHHDRICAWVSHLPQMVSTAMSAMFADEFAEAPELAGEFAAIGGRAMSEMTRLGASPYSMWRDVALTNTEPLAATLFALEQRLSHMRENLKTPELREEFRKANDFRSHF